MSFGDLNCSHQLSLCVCLTSVACVLLSRAGQVDTADVKKEDHGRARKRGPARMVEPQSKFRCAVALGVVKARAIRTPPKPPNNLRV
eukprot:2149925-Amphidinium_carterae.1